MRLRIKETNVRVLGSASALDAEDVSPKEETQTLSSNNFEEQNFGGKEDGEDVSL